MEISLLNKLKEIKEYKKKTSWEMIARENQKLPAGEWFGWLILAGRGWGKTRTGAESIKELVENYGYKRICLLGETIDQSRSVMIEGQSGLLSVYNNKNKPVFKSQTKQLIWKNGAVATCYSADNYEALRGPQFDLAWVDEFAKFDNAQEAWDQLMFCLRLGIPKVIITTTPRNKDALLKLLNRKDIIVTNGTTFENEKNLSSNFISMVKTEYENNSLGKQELYGEILTNSNNLWHYNDFLYKKEESYDYVIISVDPAVTCNNLSNETGIIIAGIKNGEYFIIKDYSGVYKVEVWIELVNKFYYEYKANKIIIENNQGGDILNTLIEKLYNLPLETVKAKESKYSRAQSIYYLYQQKKVYHCSKFDELEKQLVNAHLKYKDDRLDALVWALISLINVKEIKKKEYECDFLSL